MLDKSTNKFLLTKILFPMKKLIVLLMLGGILVAFSKSAPKVLIYVKEDSQQLAYMLTNEVGKMKEILKGAGFDVITASMSGEILKDGSVTFKPDLMFGKVNIDDYDGIIIPCMVSDNAPSIVVNLVKVALNKGKPVAAQAGGIMILAKAGLLKGKKFSLNANPGEIPDFEGGIYSGTGIVQDGNIITSGICPLMAKDSSLQDGTAKLCQTFMDAVKVNTK
jgi:4-methyl-5(b-hydroxyethyl)-thiazole monophosphate biosynthesis